MTINFGETVLTKIGGFASVNGGEIPAYDPISQRLFVVAGPVVEILAMADPTQPTKIGDMVFNLDGDPDGDTPGGFELVPNSVAVGKPGTVSEGIVAVAIAITNQTTADDNPGEVQFFDSATGNYLGKVTVGHLPDMVTFSPDGTRVLTANEGQPNNDYTVDPEGSISIVDISQGFANAPVQTATFTAFNSQIDSLRTAGVRIFGPGATVAQDLEPEYIAFSGDGSQAWVTLQENNALAIVDMASATVTDIVPLGYKDHRLAGNELDASDRDVDGTSASGGIINIRNWPVWGMYQPDSIASYTVNGQTYYITANEGDARDYDGFSEETAVRDETLNPTAFPNAADLQLSQNLGRLGITNTLGDTDNNGDFEALYAFGARSFSIWDSQGNQVFDSGSAFEDITATAIPAFFNSNNDTNNFDNRSDNKGPEPEGIAVGTTNGRTLAFIGLERVGGVMVYEVSNPQQPQFVQYLNTRDFTVDPESNLTDSAPEGLTFISAADSPNGTPLLVVSYEVSNTTAIFEVEVPAGGNVYTSPGNDDISAGIDFVGINDRIYTDRGDDIVDMTSATSVLAGRNTINLGRGDDEIFVHKDDLIYGGAGNDTFDATDSLGGNRLVGNSGNDTFFLGSGDEVFGETGDDLFSVGIGGGNILDGGAGRDTFWLVTGELPDSPNHIRNFNKTDDRIGIEYQGVTSMDDLTITANSIAIGDRVIATITGIRWTGLDASNFIFDMA